MPLAGEARSAGGCSDRLACEELDRDGGELLMELEDAAVAGVRVDDELTAFDAAMQVPGQDGGGHPVVVAVGDQRWLGEGRQVGGGGAAELLDCLQLGVERIEGDVLVAVDRALLEPLDECFPAALPVASRLKRRNSFGSDRVRVARRMTQYVTPTTLSMSLPPRGPVPVRTSRRTRSGCFDLLESERGDELVRVIGGLFEGLRHLARRGADAALVERDDVSVLGDGVDDAGSQLSSVAARWTKKTTGIPPLGPSSR